MPKDPTKNVDRYKIRGGTINEYEYHENQQALAQSEPKGDGKLIPGTPPEEKATKQSQPQKSTKSTKTKKAATGTKKAAKGTKKAAKRAARKSVRGASAKKLAARKAAKK
jgi:adenylate kinase